MHLNGIAPIPVLFINFSQNIPVDLEVHHVLERHTVKITFSFILISFKLEFIILFTVHSEMFKNFEIVPWWEGGGGVSYLDFIYKKW